MTYCDMDISNMPAVERQQLVKATLSAVERFYANPANYAAYEAWRAEQQTQPIDEDD